MTLDAFLYNYLTYTLLPALHEKRIYIDDDTYRVYVTDCSKAGSFVHIERMTSPDEDHNWTICATPGWDGATTTIPVDVHDPIGAVELFGQAVDVAWTGKVKYDVEVYLHTLRNHIVTVILPALWPDLSEEPMTKTIVLFDDGETWGICAHTLDITDKEYERISEGGEKIRNVVPKWESRSNPV
ncbi:hypothetical protein CMI37_28070 [Candidatus Pacearchaeota archaeon]|nr:hypothetical protein [Candidatus Pacearchaeota archaeon]|tara:strand:+ start:1878 stop:2429 length:552 start_codon:yes stop_codon:yes gene_type:complete